MYMVSTEGQAQLPDYRIVHIVLQGQFFTIMLMLGANFFRSKGQQQVYYLRYKKARRTMFVFYM